MRFERPIYMGVLNVTPDSFSDGGMLGSAHAALTRARELVDAGASILDIGGESTRPGSEGVDAETELGRVLPVIDALKTAQLPAALSIDTSKASVAKAALARGAHLVNDVTALRDPQMPAEVATHGAGLVLMHMRGEPRTMQQGDITYADLVGEIRAYLESALERALAHGVRRERIMLDPGIGFGKTATHNLSLTKHLDALADMGIPLLYGPSRKRFLGTITGRPVEDRDRATAGACAAACLAGAHIFRVHDVAAVRDAVDVAWAVRQAP